MADDKEKPKADGAGGNNAPGGSQAAQGKEPYPGIHPESGERMALSFEGAKKEFGAKRGAEIFEMVSKIGGFGNARDHGYSDLDLSGLDKKTRSQVDEILTRA